MPVPFETAAHLVTALAVGTLAFAAWALARGAGRQPGAAWPRLVLLALSAGVAVPLAFSTFSRLGSYAGLGVVVAAVALVAALWPAPVAEPSAVLRFGVADRALDAAALPVAAGAVLCGAAVLFALPANHDLAWLLYVGEKVLAGARPYSDLIEVNPPLVIYLSAAAAWIGRRLGVASFSAYYGMVLALAIGSAALSSWLLARLARGVTRWTATVFFFLAVPFAGTEFGQREHLLVLLFAPYLVLAGLRARRQAVAWPVAVLVALLAAVGISIKPYFVAPWLLIEGYVLARLGARAALRRPDPWVIAAAGFAYVALVLLFVPAYAQLAAWGAGLYEHFAPATLLSVLWTPRALLAVLALVAAFALPGSESLRELRRLCALAALGLLLALLWQRKGWDYHWYPVLACSLLSLALAALEAARAAPRRLAVTLAIAATCTASALARAADPIRRTEAERYPSELGRMKAIVREYAAGGPILILSTQVGAAFPLVNYTGLEWASRFNCLWFVPGLYPELGGNGDDVFPYHSRGQMGPAERWILRAYGTDVHARKPTLILVDSYETDPRLRHFEPLSFLMRDSTFAAERRRYRKLGYVGQYLVLRRADLPAPLATVPDSMHRF